MIMDKRIEFEERYDDEEYETTTFYFTADTSLLKELVGDKYPEADGMTISIEVPINNIEASEASVEISPYEDDNGFISDYDWTDIYLPYEETEALIDMALKSENNGR